MVKQLVLIMTGSMFSTLVHALSLQGVSDFAASMQLNAASAGVVRSIMVKPGQTVKPGQLLIKLDDTAHQARLQRAQARHGERPGHAGQDLLAPRHRESPLRARKIR